MTLIRTLEEADIPAILAIYRPFIENTAVSFELDTPELETFSKRVLNISNQFPFLVMVDNGIVLGYAYATSHRERPAYRWCVETSIYMASSAQGLGLGSQLYAELLRATSDRGFKIAYGLIALPNEASVALHSKCGFNILAVHKNTGFKNNAWHDVVWMEKILGEFTSSPSEPEWQNN